MRWRRDPSTLLRIQWWVLLRLFVWFLKAQIMAVVVGRSLPPAAHLHSLNSFVSKNRSPWSFRQFNIALDRSHLGKLSPFFLIWLHFFLSLSLIVQFAWNRQQVCYFDFLALQQRLMGFLVHERTVKQVVLEQQRTIFTCTGIFGQIYLNLLPCRFSCESSCKHSEPGFFLLVVPREGTRVHSSLSHRILLWLWKRVRINGIYQFDSDLNRVVKPERDLQV